MQAIPPADCEYVADDAFDALRVLDDNAQQTLAHRVVLRLGQQLAGVLDRRQRIADFMGDTARQASQRRQLDLPCLRLYALHILKKDQNVLPQAIGREKTRL